MEVRRAEGGDTSAVMGLTEYNNRIIVTMQPVGVAERVEHPPPVLEDWGI